MNRRGLASAAFFILVLTVFFWIAAVAVIRNTVLYIDAHGGLKAVIHRAWEGAPNGQ